MREAISNTPVSVSCFRQLAETGCAAFALRVVAALRVRFVVLRCWFRGRFGGRARRHAVYLFLCARRVVVVVVLTFCCFSLRAR